MILKKDFKKTSRKYSRLSLTIIYMVINIQ